MTPRQFSGIWETEPWPPGPETRGQPPFYNAVLEVDPAGRTPQALYGALRQIEIALGRERRERWGPRTLDLDILAMDGWTGVFQSELGDLILPHPGISHRAFVLAPLAEAAPAWVHPALGLRPAAMLALVLDALGRFSGRGLSFSRLRRRFALRNANRPIRLGVRSGI